MDYTALIDQTLGAHPLAGFATFVHAHLGLLFVALLAVTAVGWVAVLGRDRHVVAPLWARIGTFGATGLFVLVAMGGLMLQSGRLTPYPEARELAVLIDRCAPSPVAIEEEDVRRGQRMVHVRCEGAPEAVLGDTLRPVDRIAIPLAVVRRVDRLAGERGGRLTLLGAD